MWLIYPQKLSSNTQNKTGVTESFNTTHISTFSTLLPFLMNISFWFCLGVFWVMLTQNSTRVWFTAMVHIPTQASPYYHNWAGTDRGDLKLHCQQKEMLIKPQFRISEGCLGNAAWNKSKKTLPRSKETKVVWRGIKNSNWSLTFYAF